MNRIGIQWVKGESVSAHAVEKLRPVQENISLAYILNVSLHFGLDLSDRYIL